MIIEPYVIVATKGRAKEVSSLLDSLSKQTLSPIRIIVIGTEAVDVSGLDTHPLVLSGTCKMVLSPTVGTTYQRNVGLEILKTQGTFKSDLTRLFCVFFDDDFRPAPDWLEKAAARFAKADCVGLTGNVLADGAASGGFTEEEAVIFLKGQKKSLNPQMQEKDIDCAYGCNMAFLGTAACLLRFDENLPLYSWQEDRDYTGQCLRLGRVILYPNCVGVHLGVLGGRTSGLRFGYSQIANIYYLIRKGTVPAKAGIKQAARNFMANIAKTIFPIRRDIDYRGRLQGNLIALLDIPRGKCDPRRILEKGF